MMMALLGAPPVLAAVLLAESGSSALVVLAAVGAFVTSIATAYQMYRSAKNQKEQLQLDHDASVIEKHKADEAAESLDRSTSFTELEKALPGLGLLVDRWQKEAAAEYQLRIEAQEKAMADHKIIVGLQEEIDDLRRKLAASEAKNLELEQRVATLERNER